MKIEERPIDSVSCYEFNNRIHTASQVELIARSIKEFGFNQPIVIDEKNTILVGHGRYLAAKSLGHKTIPCVQLSNLTQQQKAAYRILDNKLQNDSTWDFNNLELELGNLEDEGFNLESWGLDALLELIAPEEQPQATDDNFDPTTKNEPPIKRGDLIELNGHRVLCGDSTSEDDVANLMDGKLADLCFTSPPYGLGKSVALSGNKTMSRKKNSYDEFKDDPNEWEHLMRSWFNASSSAVSKSWVINVQMLSGNKRSLVKFIADNSSRLVDIITWDKGHAQPAMQAGVLGSRFEWLLIFSGEEEASRVVPLSSWRGTIENVYFESAQRDNEFYKIHAATMPMHLASWSISKLCDRATSVFDPFLGSGTTLIAADQLQRICYGIEISPQYVDVIIRRYIKHCSSVNKPCSVKINGMDIKDYDKY